MKRLVYGVIFFAIGLHSCTSSSTENTVEETMEDTTNTETVVEEEVEVINVELEKDGIVLKGSNEATEFANAKLYLKEPSDSKSYPAGKTTFQFEVEDYTLAVPTEDMLASHCANSAKGQHIHFIMNNRPYSAHYEPVVEKELNAGNNVLLAFLSRSYHMSIKNETAHIVKEFNVGEAEDNFDENAPHLFYSRPKGEYVGADAKSVLLDFFLINTDLQNDGNTVRFTVNGTEFMLENWLPYFVEGLPMGENTFKLELLDAAGNLVASPFNPVERTITLKSE